MSETWKVRIEAGLHRGEVVGLYFTTVLLIVVEFCFVYWLTSSGFRKRSTARSQVSSQCRPGTRSPALRSQSS